MYLPRNLLSHLYIHLQRSHHALSPPVLLLVALEPDALCACRMLTTLLKRDFIPHKIQPVSGYSDLAQAGEQLVRPMRTVDGGSGGVVVCLGVGGLVDLENVLGLEVDEEGQGGMGGVEIWVVDARRPWNLGNVFGTQILPASGVSQPDALAKKVPGVEQGKILRDYRPGRGGIVVFDDGDIEVELGTEQEAYCALEQMPDIGEEDDDLDAPDTDSETDNASNAAESKRKRKSWSDGDEEDSGGEAGDERPRKRRRRDSGSSTASSPQRSPPRGLMSVSNHPTGSSNTSPAPSPPSGSRSPTRAPKQPSPRTLRRRLLRLRRKHESVLRAYYSSGTSYSEPISSLIYSLASDLGREDNDLLWHTIVGVSSTDLYGHTSSGVSLPSYSTSAWEGNRGKQIRQTLRQEVRRLNPDELTPTGQCLDRSSASGIIPTTARSPTDTSIRLSPEPAFLLIRHWSLYESMLHSPYLSARLHIWSDVGQRRLRKLLAKMGISLSQCRQKYTHMDMDLKRGLRERLLRFAPQYGLDGLVPPAGPPGREGRNMEGWGFVRSWGWKACLSAHDVAVVLGAILEVSGSGFDASTFSSGDTWHPQRYLPTPPRSVDNAALVDPDSLLKSQKEDLTTRFYLAYDALSDISLLTAHLPTAMHLHRAILRTGSSLLAKGHIRHLRAFRMGIVKEGPDVALFTHPGALVKLALWLGTAVEEISGAGGKRGTPMVLGCLEEERRVYVLVGTGGGAGGGDEFETKERKEKKEAKGKRKREKESVREERRQEKRRKRGKVDESREDDGSSEGAGSEEEEDESSGTESSESSEDEDDEGSKTKRRGYGRNRFGNAFQEVVEETNARVRIDSFEHCVVEVQKDDLGRFLESLSSKAVVG